MKHMEINCLGKNLHIVIKSEYSKFGDWSSFCSWYSLTKMLPDADISLNYNFNTKKSIYFSWVNKIGLKTNLKIDKALVVDNYVVAIREFDNYLEFLNNKNCLDDSILCDVKEDKYLPFVSIYNNCGGFVTKDWIHSIECPFGQADRFISQDVNYNEIKVLKLWKQVSQLYTTVSRG